ncbi:MAG: ATP-binding cassette domain-containing protein [Candidatus Abawacabacteria bacterium]|nr:ATP-binding cassette domain-containing protein [Candidatus Abawacabacteria bacterium]
MQILLDQVSKQYPLFEKSPGIWGSLKSLFYRKKKSKTAINNVSFTIPSGSFIGLLGPNGSGKTTLMKMLSGILVPTEGQIQIGQYIPQHRDHQFLQKISLVMGQKSQLWWDLPTMDSLHFFASIYGLSKTEFSQRVAFLSELLAIEDLLHTPVRKLSLGERMRCELLAALLHYPQILFLDEPTIGLDIVSQQKIRKFIKQYHVSQKATILLTSHNMADIDTLCDDLMILHKGDIVFQGSVNNFKQTHPIHPVIQLTLQQPQTIPPLPVVANIEQTTELVLQITVPYNELANVVSILLKELRIVSLSIKEPTLDEIMHDFFLTQTSS